jgi:DNA modification methylase
VARRRPTSTSSFGVSRRESHDASDFYGRFRPPSISDDDQVVQSPVTDRIWVGDSRSMDDVVDASVALVVTSPPYFAGKEYETELGSGVVPASYVEYLEMLRDVFAECRRVLEPGGRIVVNVANLGRRPYRSLSADVITILQDDLGLLLRGEVVWQKQRGATGSCAWGSFRSPVNPVLRDVSERLIIASKGRFDRAKKPAQRTRLGLPCEPTIAGDEFLEATLDVWEIPAESATRVGHPAPFPVALVERCIQLNTFEGDVVLDPFMGSGTTAVAAVRTGRHYLGYDADPAYVERAEERIAATRRERHDVRDRRSARELAEQVIAAAALTEVNWGVRLATGVDVSASATSRSGRSLLLEIGGGATDSRPGLQRVETLWRVIGKASVAASVRPDALFVVLTTAMPSRGSGGAALESVVGADKPVHMVIDLLAPDAVERLAAL